MPGKAAYLLIETDPATGNDLYIAERLGLTLGQLRRMPHAEYVLWREYYARQNQMGEMGSGGGRRWQATT